MPFTTVFNELLWDVAVITGFAEPLGDATKIRPVLKDGLLDHLKHLPKSDNHAAKQVQALVAAAIACRDTLDALSDADVLNHLNEILFHLTVPEREELLKLGFGSELLPVLQKHLSAIQTAIRDIDDAAESTDPFVRKLQANADWHKHVPCHNPLNAMLFTVHMHHMWRLKRDKGGLVPTEEQTVYQQWLQYAQTANTTTMGLFTSGASDALPRSPLSMYGSIGSADKRGASQHLMDALKDIVTPRESKPLNPTLRGIADSDTNKDAVGKFIAITTEWAQKKLDHFGHQCLLLRAQFAAFLQTYQPEYYATLQQKYNELKEVSGKAKLESDFVAAVAFIFDPKKLKPESGARTRLRRASSSFRGRSRRRSLDAEGAAAAAAAVEALSKATISGPAGGVQGSPPKPETRSRSVSSPPGAASGSGSTAVVAGALTAAGPEVVLEQPSTEDLSAAAAAPSRGTGPLRPPPARPTRTRAATLPAGGLSAVSAEALAAATPPPLSGAATASGAAAASSSPDGLPPVPPRRGSIPPRPGGTDSSSAE